MPTTDLTSSYLAQAAPGVAQAIGQLFDPRNRIAIDQARMQRELFPLQQQHLQGQTALDAARARTEGAHQGLYGAQTADQQAITGFRNTLAGYGSQPSMPQGIPQVSPLIEGAVNTFNQTLPLIPGAPQPAPSNGPATMVAAPDAPNPLLPALGSQPRSIAALVGAMSKNPRATDVVTGMNQERAAAGGYSEAEGRNIALGLRLLPNINTAITPEWQGALINNKNSATASVAAAHDAAAMDRVIEQQKGAGQRTVLSAMTKAMYGGGTGGKAPSYSDQRKMNADANAAADRVFRINRDEAGNAASQFNTDLPPAVIQQRDQLAKRIQGYISTGKTLQDATDRANLDLFGSMNTNDPQFFNQGASPLLGINRPFSAVNVNTDAMGEVQRAANPALNGPLGQGAASILARAMGVDTTQQQAPAASEPMGPPAPVKPRDTTYDILPTNEQVEASKQNKSKAESLRSQVQNIEMMLKDNLVPQDNGILDILFGHQNTDLGKDNNARNELVRKRAELMAEIERLDPASAQKGGKVQQADDIVRRLTSP